MKKFAGTPGTMTGLSLRIAQFLFAAGSIVSMASTSSFFNFTAFCYLIAAMGLQVTWSLGLALLDAYAVLSQQVLHNPIMVSLFVIGDWVSSSCNLAAAYVQHTQKHKRDGLTYESTSAPECYNQMRYTQGFELPSTARPFLTGHVTATLSLAAASASGGIAVLYFHDLGGCTIGDECQKYQLSVAFAFLSWITVFISSLIMFFLLAAG